MSARIPFWLAVVLILLAGGVTFFYYTSQQADIIHHEARRAVETGDLESALPLSKKAVQINSEKWEAHALLGEILTWQEKYPEALEHLDKALSLHENLKTRFVRAQALFFSGERAQAHEALLAILEKDPSHIEAKALLAQSYADSGEYSKAEALYQELLEQAESAGGNTAIQMKKNLGRVYLYSRQYGRAEALFKNILAIHPEDEETKLLLAKTLHYAGRSDEAAVIAESLVKGSE